MAKMILQQAPLGADRPRTASLEASSAAPPDQRAQSDVFRESDVRTADSPALPPAEKRPWQEAVCDHVGENQAPGTSGDDSVEPEVTDFDKAQQISQEEWDEIVAEESHLEVH